MTNNRATVALILALLFACLGSVYRCHVSINNPDGRSTLVIIVATTGADIDPDGYVVKVGLMGGANVESGRVAANETEVMRFETTGAHRVELGELSDNCMVAPPNPRNLDLLPGATRETIFRIVCSAE